jgi:hypothetical protein
MAQDEQGEFRMDRLDGVHQDVNIRHYPVEAVPIRAVSQESALCGIVHGSVRSKSVPTGIRSPYLKTGFNQPQGQGFIPEGMFRHAVYYEHYPPDTFAGDPAPYKKPGPVIRIYPRSSLSVFISHGYFYPYTFYMIILV